jgi:hypothetical protein
MNLELGVIGNCEIAALVDESARIGCPRTSTRKPVSCGAISPRPTVWWAS